MKAELIDVMGDDTRVVNAARVSFSKESSNYTEEQNDHLIYYLSSHGHWTPFSHCALTLRETVPIFVARQRFKHMVGFTYNEVSRRYVDDEPEFYEPDAWRGRPKNSKQGSSGNLTDQEDIWRCFFIMAKVHEKALDTYTELLEIGVAPEQARMVLPQSMYTCYYVTGSLAAWARAYKLRIDPHAQQEIRELAEQWNTIINPLFPISWKALTQ